MTNDVAAAKQAVCDAVDAVAEELISASHAIHARPELAFEERFAATTLARLASHQGLETDVGVYGTETGFSSRVGSGPAIGIICEYDALPGIGHGCGHNVIAAAGLGAAIAASRVASAMGGSLHLLGTPGEEGGGGKIVMAQNGAFAELTAAMMVHPADADLTEIDAIAIQQLTIEYFGKESHAAAAPHLGRNALDGAVLGYMGVAALRQHIRSTERIHGIFTHGGDKPNIVPKYSAMQWYIRSDTTETLEPLKERVLDALEAGGRACGCSTRHEWDDRPYANLITNAAMSGRYVANAQLLGRTVLAPGDLGHHVVGSTDMGNVSHMVPSIHPMIAIAPRGTAIHTSEFADYAVSSTADQAIIDGAKAMAMTVVDLWSSPELRGQVSTEFAGIR